MAAAALAAASVTPARAAPAAAADAGAAFLPAWRLAVARPGGEAIADLTAFPFLFEGRPLARPAFVDQAVPALFKPAVRRCLQQARPLAEQGRLVLTCAPYGFVFGSTPSGWRLLEFFVDTP